MDSTTAHQLGSASGLIFVVIFVAGFFGMAAPNPPEFGTAAAGEIRGFVEANRSRLLIQATLPILGWTFFVWFVARLKTVLARGDPSPLLPTVALGSGLLTAGLFIAFHGLHSELATAELSRSADSTILARWALIDASFALFGATTFLRAAFLAAGSLAAIPTGALPKWLAWSGVGAAAINFLDGFGVLERVGIPLFDFALFLGWVAVASVVLVGGRGDRGSSDAVSAKTP